MKNHFFILRAFLTFVYIFCSYVLLAQVPSISSFSPKSAEVGSTITITGTNFDAVAANNTVYFGSVKASVSTASTSALTVSVPKSSIYGPITVVVNGLSARSSSFFNVLNNSIGANTVTAAKFGSNIGFPSTGGYGYNFVDMVIATGDFDNDGMVDVVKNGMSIVKVHRNLLTGPATVATTSFSAGTDFTVSGGGSVYAGPKSVVVEDINSDGKLDIITSAGSGISVLINTSSGVGSISFATAYNISGSYGNNVRIADIDLDGKMDLISLHDATVIIYRNTSTSGFSLSAGTTINIPILTGCTGMGVADFNKDGKSDIVVCNSSSTVILTNGSSPSSITFPSNLTLTGGGTGLVVGDFDSDDDVDIYMYRKFFVNGFTSGSISASNFTTFTDAVDEGASAFSLADLNGDGKVEIIGGTTWDKAWVYLLGNMPIANGTVASGILLDKTYANVSGPTLGVDVDGDNKVDVVSSYHYGSSFTVTQNLMTPPPVITTLGTFSSFAKCTGSASTAQTVTIYGSNLSSNISLAALTGYEYSSNGTNYASTLTLTQSAGTVSSTVYVRMTAAATGAPSGSIVLSSTGASSVNLPATGMVNALPTVSGLLNVNISQSNLLTGSATAALSGAWTSTVPSIASVSASGLVTGISAGNTQIIYTNSNGCSISTTFTVNPPPPVLTTSVSGLYSIKACSGAASTDVQAQSFTITGSNLTANVTLTAPTGFTIGTTAAGATNTSLVLTQSSGTVSATIFVKQASISSGPPPSGNISIASTGVNTLSLGLNGGFIYSQPFGNALSFDGVDDKVTVNSANAFNFTDASSYSLEAMIYPRGFTDKAGIISKSHTNGSSGYVLRLTSSGNFRGLYFDGMETADNILELNKWYHIAAVKDGNTRHIYVNGVDIPLTGTPNTITSNSDPLVLGKDYNADATGRFFNGDLDEVRIWSIARSLVDIQATRWATLTSTETGLVIYFLMGQGTPGGNNSAQVALSSNVGGMLSGSFSGFALNGNTSNFVSSTNYPQISGGSSFSICKSSSNQLTHDIPGGTWSMNAASGISLSSSGLLAATSTATGSTQVNYAYTLFSCPFISQSFVSIPSPRPFNNALHFNGSSKVIIGNKTQANLTTNMTIEAWVNVPVGTSNINTILAKSTAGNNVQGYKFGVNEWQSGAGKLLLEAAGGTAISSTPITFGAWQHVAVVVNGNLATFYINGQVAGSGAVALQANTSASLTMGAFSDGSYLFNGTMDEVRLWTTSRSQSDIQSTMYSPLSGTESGLLAYYDFNQGMPYGTNTSIATLNDKSTSVWPGTFASFPLTGQTGNFVMNSNGPAIYGASTVCIGSTSQLGHPSSGGTWTIDGSGVTISSTGLVTIPNSITAGTRTVSYSYAYQGCTLVDTKVITIAANPVLSGTSTWSIPATSQLTATTAVSLSSPWISATPSVATVSNTGLVTGVSAGTTTITYTDVNGCVANTNVTINVSPPELSGLTVVGASFSPSFNASTITYTSSVANNVPNINITPYTTVSGAVITVNGITTSSGSLRSVTLSVGSNVIPIVVTSGNLSKTYTLTISRAVGPPTITSFSPAQVNAGGTVTITGTNFLGATAVSFGGVAASAYTVTSNTQIIATVGAGASGMVAVTNSGTTFNLVGFGVNSTNANLSALALSVGSLSPLFNASALNYTATVTAPSITITPRVAQSNATITINGTAVANNSASSSIPLNLGSNPISVVVTAQDGISTKTYTVDVTRLAASSDASLSSLMTSTGTLSPAFVSGTLNYSVSVPNNTNTLSLVPTVNEVNASLKVNNVTLASGSTSAFIPLTVGDNVITVVVTAQDGATLQTYTITVTRAPLVITYASSSITGTVDTAIASLAAPSVSGTVTSFAISPALPAGINLNSVTGEITGATAFAGTSQHIITATNSAGTATATINITIAKAGRTILGLANALAKTTSDPAFVLGASPSKGTGSITYTSSNPAVVTISGSTVTIKGVGTAVISATILADANYEGASAQSTITVIVGDSDGDGVPDSVEVAQGTNPFDASSVKDTDGDGVPDYVEVQQGTNPNNSKDAIDTDGDGVPDYIEKAQGTNPLVAGDKIKDTDGDGVPDYIEVAQGTNSAVAFDARDSDGDGIPDFVEIAAGQDPNDATSAIDSDGDGVPDYMEVKQGTNPGLAGDAKDSDGDGVPDYVELYQGTNPNSKTSFSDVDGDGFSDYLEGFNRIKGAVIPDLDGDGIPDYRDTDCDGDGIPDALENDINYGSMDDCDHDGIPNRLDKDQCGTYTTQGVSPDGDGVNDNLVIPGILSTQPNKLTVYNRTGIIVFEQSNYKNDWGGTDQAGNLLPDGVYYYVVDFNGAKPAVSTFIYISRLAQ